MQLLGQELQRLNWSKEDVNYVALHRIENQVGNISHGIQYVQNTPKYFVIFVLICLLLIIWNEHFFVFCEINIPLITGVCLFLCTFIRIPKLCYISQLVSIHYSIYTIIMTSNWCSIRLGQSDLFNKCVKYVLG